MTKKVYGMRNGEHKIRNWPNWENRNGGRRNKRWLKTEY
jgi:hypothetical protein